MALINRQQGPIALYGATGYTGKLVAAELIAAKADFILSGRSREKLEAVAEELGGDASVREARVDDPASLAELLSDCAAVINCAGPFNRFGEPVLAAAVQTSTHYLDTTGEQDFIKLAFERYGLGAARAGVAVIPAMGFDYVPGDMIASLTADGLGEIEEIVLAYAARGFKATRGTALSAMDIMRGGDVEWRNMEWQRAPGSFGRGSFDFPEPIGRQRMARYPAGEQITVPRHVPTRNVRTTITASTLSGSKAAAPLLPVVGPVAGLAMRTPLRRLAGAAVSRLPEGPSLEDRRDAEFTIVCEAHKGEEMRRGIVRGRDVYGLTGAAVAAGGLIAARGGIPVNGALAPSQAFDPKDFLAGLDRFDVSWELDRAEQRVAVEV